jgi:hypothetical protein
MRIQKESSGDNLHHDTRSSTIVIDAFFPGFQAAFRRKALLILISHSLFPPSTTTTNW